MPSAYSAGLVLILPSHCANSFASLSSFEGSDRGKCRLRKRIAYICCTRLFRRLTVKRAAQGDGIVRQCKAAHMQAASPGGPRAKSRASDLECRSSNNGLWLRYICARELDDNRSKYPAELFRRRKVEAEAQVEELATQDTRRAA